MSVYTTVAIDVIAKEYLSRDIIETLESHVVKGGVGDFVDITHEKIKLRLTFNHGYDKALRFLMAIESCVSSNTPIQLGSLETEHIDSYKPDLYLFKDRIVMVSMERTDAIMGELITYELRDLHGHDHTIDSRDFELEEFSLDKPIQEFFARSR